MADDRLPRLDTLPANRDVLDERAFVERVERAGAEELAHLFMQPTARQEKVLRSYLGDERFQRLHGLALRRSSTRAARSPAGNVVVIPGFMGCELAVFDRDGNGSHVWLHYLRLAAGEFTRLRLDDDGLSEFDPQLEVRPSGILKRHYGELLLSLATTWNVRAFWYDWRKDLQVAAAALEAQLRAWFGDAPVHLVAHSSGGLVARTFIASYPQRWEAMWDRDPASPGRRGGRLIMLGPPNHGSFRALRLITGQDGFVRKLAQIDLIHELPQVLQVLLSFPGIYHLLPSPYAARDEAECEQFERLYQAETYRAAEWGAPPVSQRHLDNARRHYTRLRDIVDPARMISVAGFDQPTLDGILEITRLDALDAYTITRDGDGSVPHRLSDLTASGVSVPTSYVEEEHGNLVTNAHVLTAIDDLLLFGKSELLRDRPSPRASTRRATARGSASLRRAVTEAQAEEDGALAALLRTRSGARMSVVPRYVSVEERQVEDLLTRHFLTAGEDTARRTTPLDVPFEPAQIEIGLECGRIEDIDYDHMRGGPIDAIAVGHYIGVKPQAAERALDEAISRALLQRPAAGDGALSESDLLLTQFTERGTLQGELGQPFFLHDPRSSAHRLIAIAGMGVPGRFGEPELTVLVRELCWALGRMGKRHLATVLIGAGNANLPAVAAVRAWIRGIKHAVTGSAADELRRLQRITFVEFDPGKIEEMQRTILQEQASLAAQRRLVVKYEAYDQDALLRFRRMAHERTLQQMTTRWERALAGEVQEPAQPADSLIPTRVTVGLEPRRKSYRLGAITATAAVPEREIPLDPTLVMRANDELAAEWDPAMQAERGRFLERLLIPEDVRPQLYTPAPLVMLLDATTARIHWEMLVQSDPSPSARESSEATRAPLRGDDLSSGFLGMSRGFTRQLRTTFAPPPEPPPPPRRVLRVLVVADPAEDARLPGAEEEGVEVADLFAAFNTVYQKYENRIEVVRLFGPREATRTNVLRELILRSYDVLHFAGHCVYDAEDPAASGWVFTGGERLSANELNRVDRIPKFVFSNACESGITPDRSGERTAALAPSFAEAFFARGVSNFVCTAWPVDDRAARLFARRLYSGLLGLESVTAQANRPRYRAVPFEPMYVAMREARRAISDPVTGGRTWGAYQHYGNPYLRLFDVAAMAGAAGSAV